MSEGLSESRFNMWRCIFAVAHVDNVVTPSERVLMLRILQDHPFSAQQRAVLLEDIETRQDVITLFARITDQADRSLFFKMARDLVWADGDYGVQEQEIILDLKRAHVLSSDFDTMEYGIIEFEEPLVDDAPEPVILPDDPVRPGFWVQILNLFRR